MLARTPRYRIKRLDPDHEAFAALAEESRKEGFWMLVTLANNWEDGRNRFDKRGEALFGAWLEKELAGVCGLNVDPYVKGRREGRVRHLYVGTAHRMNGVGRQLVWSAIDKARKHFPVLNTRSAQTAFGFYEALGFEPVEGEEFATHRMRLARPPTRGRQGN
ncbi:GNAT family N-acetyltransferase [Kumtagia ephedrae]|jgi:GNAT superfamily N-acetyltransferase|uniref:GNAT family N-acetyltransferase n=1 Tax=Kumtagia ephedrae TaxID=2116701 RepID=A0A2P7SDR0_9HYPH|nr:GNAT family N-acetyltransferase [Mesorhizobium ephedrae]PSJ60607.1 GNAT family N-acetyltransferase [Mesorhizobium ephedrae]